MVVHQQDMVVHHKDMEVHHQQIIHTSPTRQRIKTEGLRRDNRGPRILPHATYARYYKRRSTKIMGLQRSSIKRPASPKPPSERTIATLRRNYGSKKNGMITRERWRRACGDSQQREEAPS